MHISYYQCIVCRPFFWSSFFFMTDWFKTKTNWKSTIQLKEFDFKSSSLTDFFFSVVRPLNGIHWLGTNLWEPLCRWWDGFLNILFILKFRFTYFDSVSIWDNFKFLLIFWNFSLPTTFAVYFYLFFLFLFHFFFFFRFLSSIAHPNRNLILHSWTIPQYHSNLHRWF